MDGLPVTTVARTLLDLAAEVRPRRLEQAVARAERDGRTDAEALMRMVERHPRRRGVGSLRHLAASLSDPKLTRSAAEERFLSLVTRVGLPAPETNARIGRDEVDFLWRVERVAVEVDGFAFHRSRHSFVNDRRKGARLIAAGFQVIRFTWDDLLRESATALVQLARALVAPRR